MQADQVRDEEGLELGLVAAHEGAETLCVLLPGVGAQEDSGGGVLVVDVVARVDAGADVEVRMAQSAALDGVLRGQVVDPPSVGEFDGHFAARTVAEGAHGRARGRVERGGGRVHVLETSQRGGVEDAIVGIGRAAVPGTTVDVDVDAHGVDLGKGCDLRRVLHLIGIAAELVDGGFQLGGELLRAAEDTVPCNVGLSARRGEVEVERLENYLAESLVVPIGTPVGRVSGEGTKSLGGYSPVERFEPLDGVVVVRWKRNEANQGWRKDRFVKRVRPRTTAMSEKSDS